LTRESHFDLKQHRSFVTELVYITPYYHSWLSINKHMCCLSWLKKIRFSLVTPHNRSTVLVSGAS